ncbi:MAG: glycosyltransferase [Akkermansiaceae bacterium]|nr:glycosyltransferase [Akkermansiaceae bacterium]MCP5549486.1 glycosyltransferase [Akkermansiaceae bacterium]
MISAHYPEVLATLLLFIGLWLISPHLSWKSVPVRLLVVGLFVLLNGRYLYWRLNETLVPLSPTPSGIWVWLFVVFEILATLVLTWHLIVLIKPSDRRGEADAAEKTLRERPSAPGVDILIPTYNEPPEILRRTIEAARNVDYPDFEVHVLDDGNREWLRELCAEAGVRWVVRPDRRGFKAGNLNHALGATRRPLLCVVDADFALERRFLWRTVGLLEYPKIGIVQTPQVFLNPDAIQHNLLGERAWPEAQCMFTDVMQASRDTWDNAFCYGTGFVIKRQCLDLIGGFPESSITEDLLTTYVLLSHDYKTRFLNEPLSSGLATQEIGSFVSQRTRWLIGSLQCAVVEEGVFRGRDLSVVDRLFFLDPVLFHLGTISKLLVLIAPALYWWFGLSPLHSDFGHLLVVFAPRMLLGFYGFYWLSNRKTLPLVSELDRIVGIYSLVGGIFRFLANPFRQQFKTTTKSLDLKKTRIHWPLMSPHLALSAVTLGGVLYRALDLEKGSLFMLPNAGLMLSLTVYVLWLLFFACLACVQRPVPGGMLNSFDSTRRGSIRSTIASLLRRSFQWS